MPEDAWRLFSELCRRGVEDQNVYLDVIILGNCITMELSPYDATFLEEDDEE